ncbi:MAG TPA: hypothetical protein ENN42_09255 [Thioalkalivibrio sp.]|nr:hypothetical protein [Thioalkalivibrio sp.]
MHDIDILAHELSLPEGHGHDRVVQWHVFRSQDQARHFMDNIRLGEGQNIVGGRTRDSLGAIWWVGVQVDDLEKWGNGQAVNKHAASY